MVSHKYKCIFVEVPKTGSMSIRNVIGNPWKPHLNITQIKYKLMNELSLYGLMNELSPWGLMNFIQLLLNKMNTKKVGEEIFNSYFKFGFVRNPWDRTVSLYIRRDRIQMSKKMSFEEFVNWINFSSDTCIHPIQHKYQIDQICDENGDIVVDFIGRFENLNKDWGYISNKLKINKVLPHIRYNPRNNRHYTEYYTEKTKNIIAEKFYRDIEFFEYEFGKQKFLVQV